MSSELTKKYSGYGFLYSEFSREIQNLSIMIRQEQMPFFLYETYRTPMRQKKLYKRGYSTITDPYASPHVHGLAVDFLLNKNVMNKLGGDYKTIAQVVENSLSDSTNKSGNEIYNIGTNLLPSKSVMERTVVQDKSILNAWLKLGYMIESQFPKLKWGGNKNKKTTQLIGADPPHIEFYDSERLMKSRIALNQIKRIGAPGL